MRDVLRQRLSAATKAEVRRDAIRAGCAEAKIVPPVDIPIQHGDSAKRKLTDFFGAVRTEKSVDCPSETVDNGNIGCLDSRRAWENSQRGCCFCGI